MHRSFLAMCGCIAIFLSESLNAQTCSGNGCDYVVLEKVDNCVRFRATAGYILEVHVGVGFSVPKAYPGTPGILYGGTNQCMSNLLSNYTATIIGGSDQQAKLPTTKAPTPPSPVVEEEMSGSVGKEVFVDNRCAFAVEVWIEVFEPYKAGGHYEVILRQANGATLKQIVRDEEPLLVDRGPVYFYAEIRDRDYEWSGEHIAFDRYRNRFIRMLPADTTNDQYNIVLDCEDFAITDPPPATMWIK